MQVGVSSEPDHVHITLDHRDKFMILASDGIWEFISSQEAVDMVATAPSVEDACRMVGVSSVYPAAVCRYHVCVWGEEEVGSSREAVDTPLGRSWCQPSARTVISHSPTPTPPPTPHPTPQLVDEAYQRWMVEEDGVVDDITAICVKFIHAEEGP